MTNLIPNRECGPCKACCEAPKIDDPQLRKLPGVVCSNHREGLGCAIYEKRPATCQVWFCGWRMLPLGDEWRPDRCGIMIVPTSQASPVRPEDGLQFDLIKGLEKISWRPFLDLIMFLVENAVPAYVAVPRGIGFNPHRCNLTTGQAMQRAVAQKDRALIAEALSKSVQACLDHPKSKVEFENGPPPLP